MRIPFLAFLLLAAVRVTFAQNVLCTCSGTFFDRPGNCQQDCRRRLTCNGCMVSSEHCRELANVTFKRLYNNAVFGTVVGALPNARVALVNGIVDTFYPPRRHQEFTTAIGQPSGGGEEWAHVDPPAGGGLPKLTVSPDGIWISPAGLVSAIGHEMIHVEQLKRPHSVRVSNIFPAVTAFRELEASSWEIGEGGRFNWSIGPNKVWRCVPADEQEGPRLTRRCREWQVKKAVENAVTGLRAAAAVKELEGWMREEPWVNTAWLPRNPGWKTMRAGSKPDAGCPNP